MPLVHCTLEVHAEPVGSVEQTPALQMVDAQSVLILQVLPFAQAAQVPPPQSTSVS